MQIRIYPEKYKDGKIVIKQDGRYYSDYPNNRVGGTFWLACIAGTNYWNTLNSNKYFITNNNDLAHNYVVGLF